MNFVLPLTFFVCLLQAFPISPVSPLVTRDELSISPTFSLIAQHRGSTFRYNLVKFNGKDLVLNEDASIFFGKIGANGGSLQIPFSNYTTNATNPPTSAVITTSTNKTLVPPLPVFVNLDRHGKLSVNNNGTSTPGFGIADSLLTFKNSTQFLACPYIPSPWESGNWTVASGNWTVKSNSTHTNGTWTHGNNTLSNSTWASNHTWASNNTWTNSTWGNSTWFNSTSPILGNSTSLKNSSLPYHIYYTGGANSTRCPHGAQGYQITLLVQVDETVNYTPIPKKKRFYFF